MNTICRIPDYQKVSYEKLEGAVDDTALRFELVENGVKVFLTAKTANPRTVTLRWKNPLARPVQVLGDAWERGYGTFGWNSLCAEKWMPWYCVLAEEHPEGQPTTVTGYGVMTRPNAMASWSCDTDGVTLCLDVRCGGVGVELHGRTLLAAEIISKDYNLSTGEVLC